MRCIKTNEKGRSMIEMLGVLAIVGVLTVGGLAGYNLAIHKYRAIKTIDMIQFYVTQIQTLFNSQGDYIGLSPETLHAAGIIDYTQCVLSSNQECQGDSLKGPYGNLVLSAYSNTFSITAQNIPVAACVQIVTANWGGKSTGLEQMVLGSTIFDGSTPATTLPISVTDAVANCPFPNGAITWTYR